MSFKKIRHIIGRAIGIRKYLYMAEPGVPLDLDVALGASLAQKKSLEWDLRLEKLFTEYALRPIGAIHFGAYSRQEIEQYQASGFKKLVIVAAHRISKVEDFSYTDLKIDFVVLNFSKNSTSGREAEADTVWREAFKAKSLILEDYTFLNFTTNEINLAWVPQVTAGIHCELVVGSKKQSEATLRLGEIGLNCASLETCRTRGTTSIFFLKRPVVTMSDFGRNGRFGNQLFQYSFLRLVARRRGAILQLPCWPGQALFHLSEPPQANSPSSLQQAEVSGRELTDNSPSEGISNKRGVDFSGYGMLHTSHYLPAKEFIQSAYQFDDRLISRFHTELTKRGSNGKKIITIHLRRGDYGYDQFFRAPCSWYVEWIKYQAFSPRDYIIYICSEHPEKYKNRFPGFTIVDAPELNFPLSLAPYFDFLAMTLADAVAISNSSFSFFASMLNKNATKFFRPDFDKAGLVQFEPWNADPLIEKKLSSGQHKYLKSID